MKTALIVLSALTAPPVFAHPGVHMHPHANEALWLPVLMSALVIAGAAILARIRSK